MLQLEWQRERMEWQQKVQVAQGLMDSSKQMLKDERDRNMELVKQIREKGQEARLEYETKIDELRLELNKRDDTVRRLEFEVEKQQKLAQIAQQQSQMQMGLFGGVMGEEGEGGVSSSMNPSDLKGIFKFLTSSLHQKELET